MDDITLNDERKGSVTKLEHASSEPTRENRVREEVKGLKQETTQLYRRSGYVQLLDLSTHLQHRLQLGTSCIVFMHFSSSGLFGGVFFSLWKRKNVQWRNWEKYSERRIQGKQVQPRNGLKVSREFVSLAERLRQRNVNSIGKMAVIQLVLT